MMKRRKRNALVKLLKTLLMMVVLGGSAGVHSGCSDEYDKPVSVEKVLLVYLAGDSNLSGESFEKLNAICRGYSSEPHTRLLLYRDARGVLPCFYEADGNGAFLLIEQFDTENSADPAVFARMITRAKAMYPQAAFNLLVFSHASGWLPAGGLSDPIGITSWTILMDGANEMALADFAAAIPDGAFDCIVFETCFMAGIEVVWQLRHKANYIAASSAEIVSPGFTPVYGQCINELVTGNPEKFMREVFACFDGQTGYMRSATFSIVKTEKLKALAEFVKQNCDFAKPVTVNEVQHFDRNTYRLFCDIEDYYSRLLDTQAQVAQLQRLIGDCVIWKAATPHFMEGHNGFAIHKYSGLTGYIPQARYPVLNESYTALEWYKAIAR